MTITNEVELAEVESQAQQVVRTITSCIDVIRSIKAFHPITVKTAMLNKSEPTGVARPRTVKEMENTEESVYLFQVLEEKGLFKQVQDICFKYSFPVVDVMLVTAGANCHPLDADRRRVLYQIFLPLLDTLSHLFKILDEAAIAPPSSTTNLREESKSNNSKKDTMNGRRGRKKPDAPRGLLSLSNYTDIACLLELTVCTSIIPLLERHVQSPIKDRTKHLPKSLAGRLHRSSLHWGTDALQYKSPAMAGENLIMRQNRAAMKIDRASKELSDVTVTICKVLLLDRFRPMLLPRHATDVYSALFQVEALTSLRTKFTMKTMKCFNLDDNSADITTIRSIFLHSEDEKSEAKEQILNLGLSFLDFNTMVKSYQTLLLSGKHAPVWLKSKISSLLTGLATSSLEGMKAIIDVFVVAASSLPTDQDTGASSRLGRVLCTKSMNAGDDDASEYYDNLFEQLMALLLFDECNFADENSVTDNRVVASVLTTWAVLENLPKELTRRFFRCIIEGLVPSKNLASITCNSLKQSVRRIHSLLLFPPNSGKSIDEFCLCLLSDVDTDIAEGTEAPGCVSAMGHLLRIATARGDQVLHSDVITETKNTINLIVYIVVLKWNLGNYSCMSGEQFLAVSLMRAVISNPIDMLGYYFERRGDEISLQKSNESTSSSLLSDMERRATFIVTDIICKNTSEQENQDHNATQSSNTELFRRMECFTGCFFKLQLLVYFQASIGGDNLSLPNSIIRYIDEFKIASMIFLPLLCEKCSPGALLTESDSSSRDVMYIMRLIITSTSQYFGQREGNHSTDKVASVSSKHSINFEHYDTIPTPFKSKREALPTATAKHAPVGPDIESQLSIGSIVLSILVTILELGSSNRTDGEENELRLLVPHLSTLCTLPESPSVFDGNGNNVPLVLQTEMAEMASHAVALIQARSLKELPRERNAQGDLSLHAYLRSQLKEIETNLASDQPPLRAYAVSELRKLARGTIEILKDSKEFFSGRKAPVVEIQKEDSSLSLLYLAKNMLRLCIVTLDDNESYVYLASIHTIVSMVDQLPKHFMPTIIHAVTSGNLNLGQEDETLAEHIIGLLATQRVKLVEAMHFIIRRRGSAIQNYSTHLMNSILYGTSRIGNTTILDIQTQRMIQAKTESYFLGERNKSAERPLDLNEDRFEQGKVRLMTGGPLFDMEENDVIRSAIISILAELLSVLEPSSAARYCATLVPFATYALILDHSRLVRRASAFLSRELYLCALRELIASKEDRSSEYILSLISSGEDKLFTALNRAHNSDDLDLKTNLTLQPSVSGKSRLYDSATIARCKEAISCRQELEEDGIINAATLILKAQEQDYGKNSIAAFISKEIGGAKRIAKLDLSIK